MATVRRWTSPRVSAANGLGSLSLTTNPGSVTVTDTGTAGGSFTYTVNDGGTPQCDRYGQCHGQPRHEPAIDGTTATTS